MICTNTFSRDKINKNVYYRINNMYAIAIDLNKLLVFLPPSIDYF